MLATNRFFSGVFFGINDSALNVNNRNFDNCVNCVDVIDNGYNTGSQRSSTQWTFQPPVNVKGDVARMIFYMVVRYEGGAGEPDLELTNTLLTNTSQQPLHAKLSTLLEWHRQDPVSNWERNRNLVIYNNYQQNRNPFIDYPELAEYLFGDSIGMVWKPQTRTPQAHPNPPHRRHLSKYF